MAIAQHSLAPPTLREPTGHHVLLGEVASGHGMALLPQSFTRLRRAGVAYRALAEGDALAVGIGLATPRPERAAGRRGPHAGGALKAMGHGCAQPFTPAENAPA